MKIWAFTFDLAASSSFLALQVAASSGVPVHSGSTLETKIIFLPSGDQIGPSASVAMLVRRWVAVTVPVVLSKSAIQICWPRSLAFPLLEDRKRKCLPSGDQRGRAESWSGRISRSVEPGEICSPERPGAAVPTWVSAAERGTIQTCGVLVLASRLTSTTENATHLPSGEGTGSPTRLSFIMSSKVKGCLAWAAAITEKASRSGRRRRMRPPWGSLAQML